MPDSKPSILPRWTRPFVTGVERRVTATRMEPGKRSWVRGRTAGPQRLHSVATFDQVLRHERARSLRSGQAFCLVRFALDGDRRTTHVVGPLVNRLVARLREVDEIGWLDTRSIGIVLPYAAPERGWSIVDEVCEIWPKTLPRRNCQVFRFPSMPIKKHVLNGNGKPAGRNGTAVKGGKASASGNGASINEELRNGDRLHGTGNGANGNGGVRKESKGKKTNGTHKEKDVTQNGDVALRNGDDFQDVGNGTNGNGSNGKHSAANGDAHKSDEIRCSARAAESMEPLFVLDIPWWKRATDIVGASVLLVLAAPIMLAAAVAIKLTSRGPVIFRQQRSGLGGPPFTILKFRTMTVGAHLQKDSLQEFSEQDGPAFKLANDPRTTRVGRWLRETSIDELPQLWNILMGDMSLVGPRAMFVDESDLCETWQRRRLDVTPGLTGFWQVHGRSTVSFVEWMRMDLQYLASRSFFNDVKLLLMTVPAVLLRRGAQ